MKILAIETSCDETSVAVVEDGRNLLSNVVASSVSFHRKTGGIVPEVAARKQVEFIIPTLDKSLRDSKHSLAAMDAFAVTIGPGLIGSLVVGIAAAKTLSIIYNKPIIPVNHLLGHLYANWLSFEGSSEVPRFPLVGLVVSGGHTDLVFMRGHKNITYLGGTRDDAAGEAFDKVARMLNLGYPGGPAIDKIASEFKGKKTLVFPRPLLNSKDYDFSFSGLKTKVLETVKSKKYSNLEIAYEFQEAVLDVLVEKTVKAALEKHVSSVVVAGGVSANSRLRERLLGEPRLYANNVKVYIPPVSFCTDNAAYIGVCAYYHYNPKPLEEIKENPGLRLA